MLAYFDWTGGLVRGSLRSAFSRCRSWYVFHGLFIAFAVNSSDTKYISRPATSTLNNIDVNRVNRQPFTCISSLTDILYGNSFFSLLSFSSSCFNYPLPPPPPPSLRNSFLVPEFLCFPLPLFVVSFELLCYVILVTEQ
jgi:hypothetical protein